MIPFLPITIQNANELKPYLDTQPFRTCDYTLGAVFQWRAYFHSAYAIVHGMLVMLATYQNEGVCFVYPVGSGDLFAALDAVEAHAKEAGMPLTYCAVPEEGLAILSERYGERAIVSTHRNWADYLYNACDLIDFPALCPRRSASKSSSLERIISSASMTLSMGACCSYSFKNASAAGSVSSVTGTNRADGLSLQKRLRWLRCVWYALPGKSMRSHAL